MKSPCGPSRLAVMDDLAAERGHSPDRLLPWFLGPLAHLFARHMVVADVLSKPPGGELVPWRAGEIADVSASGNSNRPRRPLQTCATPRLPDRLRSRSGCRATDRPATRQGVKTHPPSHSSLFFSFHSRSGSGRIGKPWIGTCGIVTWPYGQCSPSSSGSAT